MVDHLIDLDATADEILAMDKQLIELKAKRIFWVRVAVVTAILIPGLLASLVIWAVFSIKSTQENGTPTGKAILSTADRIESCTSPQGECYKRNQENLAGAIGSINDYTIFAIACGVNLVQGSEKPTPAQVKKCVTDAIAEDEGPP